ncbi:MAG TPA: DUF3995 domain-containing protein [Candidatus Agrococcus pullicola]|uniref:DUF3995 domain-containing protein n=1 Tax=Candidatus Agrococcus pullicola TaxID=2838429 RepID=A0A9D2C8L5_9MICO|nr:DUF3995 domain-containing protein [Candidatus Agrococcus pullicola]
MSRGRQALRLIGWAGLTAAGALHAVWASGSSWPARNKKELSRAVVGNSKALPDANATLVVAGAAFAGGAIAAGGLGEGRIAIGLRRIMGIALLARAAAGGDAALTLLGLPEKAGKRFRELDRRYYRPLFGALGLSVLLSAKK